MYIESEFALLEANNEQLTRENKKLVEALEYYANPDIYTKRSSYVYGTEIMADGGHKAKQALAKVKEE